MGQYSFSEKATLKLARDKQATVSGVSTCLIKVPGTVGSNDGRVVSGGEGYFESQHLDDRIELYVTDEDDILGNGAGATVGSYTDTELPATCQGWFIPFQEKYIILTELADLGFVPSGLYLKIIATTGDTRVDTFRVNIKWGKRE